MAPHSWSSVTPELPNYVNGTLSNIKMSTYNNTLENINSGTIKTDNEPENNSSGTITNNNGQDNYSSGTNA